MYVCTRIGGTKRTLAAFAAGAAPGKSVGKYALIAALTLEESGTDRHGRGRQTTVRSFKLSAMDAASVMQCSNNTWCAKN